MGAFRYTRVGDFTDDEAASKGGRSEQDSAQLDAELDLILTALNDYADKLDLLVRSDNNMVDNVLQGHEFSSNAITALKALVGNQNAALNWTGEWSSLTSQYEIGDLVKESGNCYICLVDHSPSGVFATDLAALKWEMFAQKGDGASFPGTPTANDVLYSNGATELWGKVTAAMAPIHALINNTTLTGTASVANATLSGILTVGNVTSTVTDHGTGTTLTANFAGPSLQKIDWSTAATAVSVATSNRKAGVRLEIYIKAHASSERLITFESGWVWVGFEPASVLVGKSAVLTLLCFGTATTDVIASWAEA